MPLCALLLEFPATCKMCVHVCEPVFFLRKIPFLKSVSKVGCSSHRVCVINNLISTYKDLNELERKTFILYILNAEYDDAFSVLQYSVRRHQGTGSRFNSFSRDEITYDRHVHSISTIITTRKLMCYKSLFVNFSWK